MTILELYNMMSNFINNQAVTKDDIKGLAKAEDVTALGQKVDVMQTSLDSLKASHETNVAATTAVAQRTSVLEAEMAILKTNEVKRQMHERRMNLLVLGKAEQENETKRACRDYIRKLLVDLKVPDAETLTIVDAHRLGKQKEGTVRPIIFRVPDMFIVKDILDKVPELRNLDDYSNVYFRKHLPKSMKDERKKLKNKMQELYDNGMRPKWQIDFDTYTSYILDKDGRKYFVPKE